MPDDSKKLQIDISTVATGTGAQDTAKSLEKVTGSTTDASNATEKLTGAHEEASKGAEKLEINHRLLLKTFGQLGPAGREVGESLIAMGEGPLGGLLVLLLALNGIKEMLDGVAEAVKKVRDAQAEMDTKVWEEQMEAAGKAADTAQEYADKLTKIATETDKVKQAEQLELAVLQAKQEAQKQILAAQEKAELANAHGDKDAEDEIRRRYGDKAASGTLADENAKLQLENYQLFNRKASAGGLKGASDSAESAYEKSLADPKALQNKAVAEEFKKKQGDLDKAAAEFDIPALEEKLKTASRVGGESGGQSEFADIQGQLEEAKKAKLAADSNRANSEQMAAVVRDDDAGVHKAKLAAEKAAEAYTKNQAAIDELTEKIKAAAEIFNIHKQTAQTIQGIEAPQTPFGQALLDERGNAQKVASGLAGNVSPGDQQIMTDLGAMITGHSVSLQQAAQAILKADSSNQAFMQAISAMSSTADAIRNNSNAAAAKWRQIQYEIEQHTRDIDIAYSRINHVQSMGGAP